MKILSLVQGTPEWAAHRASHFNASDAPAMMGVSKYTTRNELLRRLAMGYTPEVDAATQRRFADGHAAEAAARPAIEALIGEELYPATATSDEYAQMSASLDGVTMDESLVWECKLYNKEKADYIQAHGMVPPTDYWQCVQQLIITRATKLLYTLGDTDTRVEMALDPLDEKKLLSGWAQFAADLQAYKLTEPAPVIVAEVVDSLPAVSVRMDGAIAVISNLDVFGERLKAYVAELDKNPSTDQAFANAESACKRLKAAEDALEQSESAALAQIEPVEAMRRTVADYKELARSARLLLEKIVKQRKESIRIEIQQKAAAEFAAHVAAINVRLGMVKLSGIVADFAGAMRGKKTLSSVQGAADDELARAKIEANAVAEKMETNLRSLRELAADHKFLFSDVQQIIGKENDDLRLLILSRIEAHQKAEEAKAQKIRDEAIAAERLRVEVAEIASHPEKELAQQVTELVPRPLTNKPIPQPEDAAILAVIANHYRVSQSLAFQWLLGMDFDQLSETFNTEKAA
jgi:putative phage-type endonuclease